MHDELRCRTFITLQLQTHLTPRRQDGADDGLAEPVGTLQNSHHRSELVRFALRVGLLKEM